MGWFSSDEEQVKCNSCENDFKISKTRQIDGYIYCENCSSSIIKQKEKKRAELNHEDYSEIIVTTTNGFESYEITEYLGPISAQAIFGVNDFEELLSTWTATVGGRMRSEERAMNSSYDYVKEDLKKEAYMLGADAVIGAEFDGSMEIVGEGTAAWGDVDDKTICVSGTGTAVKLNVEINTGTNEQSIECPECGNEVEANNEFCTNCGQEL